MRLEVLSPSESLGTAVVVAETTKPKKKKRLISMGAGFEQRPWEPTKRRGPISAEMKTPGPACVDLPPLLGKSIFSIFL